MSTRFPGTQLLDSDTGDVLRHYPYFIRLRTESAWRVPLLFGRLPRKPEDGSSSEEKGRYGLFMMLLFRPWRGPNEVDFVVATLRRGSRRLTEADAWERIYGEYFSWRETEVDGRASRYLPGVSDPPIDKPKFDSPEWWACMTRRRLRHLELVLSKYNRLGDEKPLDLDMLPPLKPGMGSPSMDGQDQTEYEELGFDGLWHGVEDNGEEEKY